MQQYAQGRLRRIKPRDPQKEPFPFQELLPLQLKNTVSSKRDVNKSNSCIGTICCLLC